MRKGLVYSYVCAYTIWDIALSDIHNCSGDQQFLPFRNALHRLIADPGFSVQVVKRIYIPGEKDSG